MAAIDTTRAEAFGDKLLGILNGGALALMISVGHRTRLFDAMAGAEPATSDELAARARLNERYVREWLGAMVTGGIVHVDPATRRYHLPAEHAALLTRAARPDNLAAVAQYIPLLGTVEDDIVECFRWGGGVPYSRYGRFHEVMIEDSDQTVVAGLEDHVIPLVPGLKERLDQGIDVLDVGCGSGRALNALSRRFPTSRFTGYDISEEAIANAQNQARGNASANTRFAVKDATFLGDTACYDLITAFDAIHDQARPADVLAGIHRALRPDGVFIMQDIKGHTEHHENVGHPIAPLLYTISTMHCMSVSLAAGGAGLGAMWGREQAENMLREAGFSEVTVRELPHDIQNFWYIIRK